MNIWAKYNSPKCLITKQLKISLIYVTIGYMNPTREAGHGLKEAWIAAKNSFKPVPGEIKKVFTPFAHEMLATGKDIVAGMSAIAHILKNERPEILRAAVRWGMITALAFGIKEVPNVITGDFVYPAQAALALANGALAVRTIQISPFSTERVEAVKQKIEKKSVRKSR